MVDWAIVEWMKGAVRFEDIDEIDKDGHFYALMGAYQDTWEDPHLLYVGLAFDQHVVTRAKQPHPAYAKIPGYLESHPRREIIATIGRFVKDAQSVRRLTEQFAKDVESVLIHVNQPLFNSKHIDSCAERPLVVVSTGDFSPFEAVSACCDEHFDEWQDADV